MTYRRVFTHAYKSYKHAVSSAFGKYLFFTNVFMSMSMSTAGDLIEQNYEIVKGELDKIDLERTTQMTISGMTSGIICHHWYKFIDKVLVGRTPTTVVKKLLLDQCISSPIIILSFFATVALFEEDPLTNFNEEVTDKFWILYKAEWMVWPPAQIINFYFLPTRFRVLYDNIISLGYDIYTSQVKHSNSRKRQKDQ